MAGDEAMVPDFWRLTALKKMEMDGRNEEGGSLGARMGGAARAVASRAGAGGGSESGERKAWRGVRLQNSGAKGKYVRVWILEIAPKRRDLSARGVQRGEEGDRPIGPRTSQWCMDRA